MATYTENYGLHQWEGTDDFIRSDFNEDFLKIDTAIGAVQEKADEVDVLRESIADNGYNIYNLMLQNYYEGKYTGYKQALVFDGFMDDDMIETMTAGAWRNTSDKLVEVLSTGAESIISTYYYSVGSTSTTGSDSTTALWVGNTFTFSTTRSFSLDTYGLLKEISLRIAAAYSSNLIDVQLSLSVDGVEVAVTDTLTVSGTSYQDYVFTLENPTLIAPGKTYTVTITNVNQVSYLKISRAGSGTSYMAAISYIFEEVSYDGGSFQTIPLDLDMTYDRLYLWARHNLGLLDVSLVTEDGAQPLEVVSVTSTQTLEEEDCQETTFTLENITLSDSTALLFSLTSEGEGCILYDYGMMII